MYVYIHIYIYSYVMLLAFSNDVARCVCHLTGFLAARLLCHSKKPLCGGGKIQIICIAELGVTRRFVCGIALSWYCSTSHSVLWYPHVVAHCIPLLFSVISLALCLRPKSFPIIFASCIIEFGPLSSYCTC